MSGTEAPASTLLSARLRTIGPNDATASLLGSTHRTNCGECIGLPWGSAVRDWGNQLNGQHKGVGWIAFAGVLLILSGINTFVNGLWALNASETIKKSFEDTLLFSDKNLDTWGWIYVVIGVVVVAAGIAIFSRAQWARWVGIVVASIGAISAFFWLFNPNFWVPALVSVTLNVLVLHALISYGDREDATTV
jgi:uncharacterized protein YjeT (DUF2065 family)